MSDMNQLTSSQKEAINTLHGPVLILAGAGTGKTLTLTTRIANLILSEMAKSHEILAVTFTNKAAREMQERIGKMCDITGMMLGTFHSISVRFLRIHYKAVNLEKDFIIIDESDRNKLFKKTMLELSIDDKRFNIKLIAFIISNLKEAGIFANEEEKILQFKYKDLDIVKLYQVYQQNLKIANALDFDDLILFSLKLFKDNPLILNDIQERFKFISVDEYQDTNKIQHQWLSCLAGKYKNICCVGDEDQSIYGWRGAEIKHILNFPQEFLGAKVIKLEDNYRSSQSIINCASAIIKKNRERYDKTLVSRKEIGNKPKVYFLSDDRQENKQIAHDILKLNQLKAERENGFDFSKMAVLVRSSYQTRSIEESFIYYKIPYKIIDGFRFYDRQEIKDLIAYLRLVNSQNDFLAFERIINIPKRGIGEASVQKIFELSKQNNNNLFSTIDIIKAEGLLRQNLADELMKFKNQISSWQNLFQVKKSLSEIAHIIYKESGYANYLISLLEEDPDNVTRIDNVREFIASLEKFSDLTEFLEHIALMNANINDTNSDSVNIMTMHGAKGLEFDAVFLPGWNEDIFPSKRSVEDGSMKGIEEERRLAYVAITRAKKELFIYSTATRYLFGKVSLTTKSRFIDEIKNEIEFTIKQDGNKSSVDPFALTKSNFSTLNSVAFNSISSSNKSSLDDNIKINSKVINPKYGKGIICNIIGKFYEIRFEDGIKRVIDRNFVKSEN